jgi:hypothetical protein
MNKLIVRLVVGLVLIVPALALAQPSGSGSSAVGSAPVPADPAPAPPPTPEPPKLDARKACTDAMNADPAFEKLVVETADRNAAQVRLAADLAQHDAAAKVIAKNEKHVILAYAAMWIIAAGFVMFLWRRQQALKGEIAQLKADLDAAVKDGK